MIDICTNVLLGKICIKHSNCFIAPVHIQAPLCVEGWVEALHEIGRLSFETVLSPQNAASLLKAVEDIPVLVITGAEDALVSLKSVQTLASKLVNSVSFPITVFYISI